jgi:hypothetical protein
MSDIIDVGQYIVHKSLIQWAIQTKENTDRALYRSVFLPTLKTSSVVESASSWLQAGCAAIAGLLITNSSALAKVVPIITIRNSVILLMGAFVFGAIAKFCSLYIIVQCNADEAINELMATVLKAHNEEEDKMREIANNTQVNLPPIPLDFIRPLQDFIACSPFYLRWYIRRAMNRSYIDYTFAYKNAIKYFYAQSSALVLQTVCFVAAIVNATIYAKVA